MILGAIIIEQKVHLYSCVHTIISYSIVRIRICARPHIVKIAIY